MVRVRARVRALSHGGVLVALIQAVVAANSNSQVWSGDCLMVKDRFRDSVSDIVRVKVRVGVSTMTRVRVRIQV